MPNDCIVKFHTEDLSLRASAAYTTEIVQKLQKIHQAFPIASIAMGRLITGALLMASGLAEKQQLSMRVQGDGPLGDLSTDASFEAQARAYCAAPQLDLAPVKGHLPIGSSVGQGVITLTRTHEFHKHPQVSIVEIRTGEIAEDIAYYYQQSHQIPSIVALCVSVDKDGKVKNAGGIIIELMPGAPKNLIQTLEKKALIAPPLSEMLAQGKSLRDIVKNYVHDSVLKETPHPHPIKYFCPCSTDRVERTLKLMGKAALAEMILKAEPVHAKCQFCGRDYAISLERVRGLHDEMLKSELLKMNPDTTH